jgi:hypothetical protein
MFLHLLPVVVFDQLFEELGPIDLVNLSYTCRSLHEATSRFLYTRADHFCEELEEVDGSILGRGPHGYHSRLRMLEQALLHNPRNAQFLHSHTSFDVDTLKDLWQQTPLTLKWLRLPSMWFESSNEEEISACVLAKHADTSIRDIIVGEDEAPETGYLGVFQLMHTFLDLTRLAINIHNRFNDEYLDPDQVISDINCPNLEELILSSCDIVVSLDGKLPSLKFLVIDTNGRSGIFAFSDTEKDFYTKGEKWDRINALYNKGVQFAYLRYGVYGFVVQYAMQTGQDPWPLIRWLLNSDSYLHSESSDFVLDLTGFKLQDRDQILGFLKEMEFKEVALCISLYSDDNMSILDRLPKNIKIAEFDFVAHIQPAIIRQFISMQPGLLALDLKLYLGRHDSIHETADGTFQCLSSCMDNPLRHGFPRTDMPDPLGYVFEVSRESRPTWVQLFTAASDEDPRIGQANSEVENEVTDWFLLSPTLRKICIVWWFRDLPSSGLYDATTDSQPEE